LDHASPVKGAIALARGLSEKYQVSLVALNGIKIQSPFGPEIKVLSLDNYRGLFNKYIAYSRLLQGPRKTGTKPVSISFCFPADLVNVFQKNRAIIISSMRGMFTRSYRASFGRLGYLLAVFHIYLFKFYDRVIVMTQSMQQLLKQHGVKNVLRINNFLDEISLIPFRKEEQRTDSLVRFLFLGNLNKRKQPQILIPYIKKLIDLDYDCKLTFIGDGPFRESITNQMKDLKLEKRVELIGFIPEPYDIIQETDFLLLPSKSEGLSRSVMEALFFGIPCIMSNIDGADEIIKSEKNGYLYNNEEELIDIMIGIISEFTPDTVRQRKLILPDSYRYRTNIERYLNLIDIITSS